MRNTSSLPRRVPQSSYPCTQLGKRSLRVCGVAIRAGRADRGRRLAQPGDGARGSPCPLLRAGGGTCRRGRAAVSERTMCSTYPLPALLADRWVTRIAWVTRIDGARRIYASGPVVARSGVDTSGDELAAQRALQRAGDDVLGVGVVPDVVGDRVDRLLVAVQRVEAVDAAVVEPVAEHLLSAWGRSGGRARGGQGRQQRCRDDERRDECAEWADFVDETSFHRAAGSAGWVESLGSG